MMIDTHAHLWFDGYGDDLPEVLARAKEAGVAKMIVPGTDLSSSIAALKLAKNYPGVIYPAVGIHPEEAVKVGNRVAETGELKTVIAKNAREVVAVGEVGIDLYTEEARGTLPEQQELFRQQLELALEFDLPVIIHTRNSFAEAWEVITSLKKMPRGQFHCFSVDEEALNVVLSAGFYVSFCANITWSKRVARLVPLVPNEKLLLETDSPFMAPGARNEPSNLADLAQQIAQLRGVARSELEQQTTSNALALFNL